MKYLTAWYAPDLYSPGPEFDYLTASVWSGSLLKDIHQALRNLEERIVIVIYEDDSWKQIF